MMQRDERVRPQSNLLWVDAVKGLALIWIVWNHVSERIFGDPYIANPTAVWPSLHERIAQLAPIGHGIFAIVANLVRYIGWAGDQGVGLFIVASGFLLALGQIQRPAATRNFYTRRVLRIFPLWLAAHAAFIVLWFVIGKGLDPTDPRTLASLLGLRFLPSVFYYFSPAWWYVGLALQLYLIFPLLATLMQRIGALRFTLWCIAIACVIRGIGLYTTGQFVDEWSRGGIFITRLPEFVLGMGLAAAYAGDAQRFERLLRVPQIVAVALAVWIAGNALSLTLWGMSVAPLLLSAGAFVLAYAFSRYLVEKVAALRTGVEWSGRHSYSLYLAHQPIVSVLVAGATASILRQFVGIAAAIVGALVFAMMLEWIAARGESFFNSLASTYGARRVTFGTGMAVLALYAALLGSEVAARAAAPLEVFGWGERVSLQPDPVVGWKLKPDETHRLRWTSYDYTVQSNSLGFSGPLYPLDPPSSTFRIFTLGDAFTSAEGVDTPDSWPRRLENILRAEAHRPVQVMNFGITGYGPNQYAAVVREYVPKYRPNLVVIGMFVNDFEDAQTTDAAFQKSIGFGKPPADGIISLLELEQLKTYWSLRVRDPIISALRRRPSGESAFLSNIRFLDRSQKPRWIAGARITRERYAEIKALAQANGGRVAVVLFPASVQVCAAKDLRYYPHFFSLRNSARYDPDLPQNLAAELTSSLGLPYHDLRPDLRAAADCPYQARNMHLTVYGQGVSARAIAAFLRREGLVPAKTLEAFSSPR